MVTIYANDASLSFRSVDIHQLNEALSKELTTVVEWLKGNKLSLNVTKTKAMDMLTKQEKTCLAINNEELSLNIQEEPKDNILIIEYLGIQMDRNLDWKGHIKAVSSKISRAIGF